MMSNRISGMKAAVLLLLLAAAAVLLAGCAVKRGEEKLQDLEFTVVGEDEIPDALAEQIEEHKAAEFQLSYSDNEFLYIARGYGEQETGGYSISVKEFYLAENAICLNTQLSGPQVGEQVNAAPSYPYIVLKTELRDEKVVLH